MSRQLIEENLELTNAELDNVIAEAEADRNRADARIAAAASLVSARQGHRDDGYQSMRSYLKGTLNCSGTRANKIRKQAAAINEHPAVGDTWARGHVGTEQVDLLAKAHSHERAGHRFAEFESLLLDHAEHLVLDDLDVVVSRFISQADPDGAFDDQQFQEDEATANVSVDDGAVEVHASGGSPQQAEEMSAVFELAGQAEFEKGCEAPRAEFGDDALAHPLPRTSQQRKFAALHQIFMAWAAVPADGKTPKPLVNLVIDHVTAGNVLCGIDGNDRRPDPTHRNEWIDDDGPTDQANAMPLCGPHDRWKHTSKIRSRRAVNGRIYLIRPDGTTIKPVGEREPEWAEPPAFGHPEPDPPSRASQIVDLARTITWAEFAASRPHLGDVPDPGWKIIAIDISTG